MIFLSLLLAHLIGDFYLQTNDMVTNKPKFLKRHLLHHLIVTFSIITIMSFINPNRHDTILQIAGATLAIIVLHYSIDKLKIVLSDKYTSGSQRSLLPFYLFIADQFLHIGSLLLVSHIFFRMTISESLYNLLTMFHLIRGHTLPLSILDIVLYLLTLFIIATTVSGHAIRLLLGGLPNHLSLFEGKVVLKDIHHDLEALNINRNQRVSEEYSYMITKKTNLSRGKIIGYFERLLVIILVVHSAFTSIAFIIAAKSLARFKQMDDRDFAEYFLLGTLSSIFLGILFGMLTKLVLF